MGRNSRRKNERQSKTTHIKLTGEQAEVFDEQMDSDRDWFKRSSESVRFRPEIDGEWNEHLMLGHQAPYIKTYDIETGKGYNAPLNWVCVVDIFKAIEGGDSSGCRTRYRCPAPINGVIRKAMAEYAIDCTRLMIKAVKGSGPPQASVTAAEGSGKINFMFFDRD
jgi:hypothetical protein